MSVPSSREDLAAEVQNQADKLAFWTSAYDRREIELREAKGERERAQINLKLAIRALRDFRESPPSSAEKK